MTFFDLKKDNRICDKFDPSKDLRKKSSTDLY